MSSLSRTAVLAALLMAAGVASATPGNPEGPAGLTRAEALAKAGERFDAMDTDKDGVLSPPEMRAAREAAEERRAERHDRRGDHREARRDAR